MVILAMLALPLQVYCQRTSVVTDDIMTQASIEAEIDAEYDTNGTL
jgi:hypothetical protein